MKEKIAEILKEKYLDIMDKVINTEEPVGIYPANVLADQILSLPVEGFEVKEKCPLLDNGCTVNYSMRENACPKPCTYSRPLTLGELPERARKMKGALIDLISLADDAMREANNDGAEYDIEGELQDAKDALTFNGERIRRKE